MAVNGGNVISLYSINSNAKWYLNLVMLLVLILGLLQILFIKTLLSLFWLFISPDVDYRCCETGYCTMGQLLGIKLVASEFVVYS